MAFPLHLLRVPCTANTANVTAISVFVCVIVLMYKLAVLASYIVVCFTGDQLWSYLWSRREVCHEALNPIQSQTHSGWGSSESKRYLHSNERETIVSSILHSLLDVIKMITFPLSLGIEKILTNALGLNCFWMKCQAILLACSLLNSLIQIVLIQEHPVYVGNAIDREVGFI